MDNKRRLLPLPCGVPSIDNPLDAPVRRQVAEVELVRREGRRRAGRRGSRGKVRDRHARVIRAGMGRIVHEGPSIANAGIGCGQGDLAGIGDGCERLSAVVSGLQGGEAFRLGDGDRHALEELAKAVEQGRELVSGEQNEL